MEIGEQQLSGAHKGVLWSDRFLDLYYHICISINVSDGREEMGAHRHIVGIGESTILTCSLLNIHCMTMFHQLGDTRRGHTYPILIVLNLFWNTDFHSHKDF